MPAKVEIEAKYAVPDGATFEKLRSLEALGEYRLVARGELRFTDRYLDTPERDLLRAGYAFRRRAIEGSALEVVTVKGLGRARGAVHRRSEHEMEVPPGSPPGEWPDGPGRDVVLGVVGDRPLAELFTLSQGRTVRDVEVEGRRVAELSLDRVEFGGPTTSASHELEIELTPSGNGADLRAVAKLLGPFGLRPQTLSKFERALALLDGEGSGPPEPAKGRGARTPPSAVQDEPKRRGKPMGVLPGDAMSEAGRKILRLHYEQMLAHEAGTIAGADPEELHDMRVATRRQRAALRIFEPHYRRKAIRPVREGLRALGGFLGAVRDLDVLLATAGAYQSTLPAAEAGAFQGLIDSWTRRRDVARAAMLEHLGGRDYAQFKESHRSFLVTPGAAARIRKPGAMPSPTLVTHVLRAEIWAHYGAVAAFGPVLPSASVEVLHALRIEGKRLRYLFEFFREVLDRRVEKAIGAVVALQDHLGELQDAVVTIGLVGEFLSGPEVAAVPGAAAAANRYAASRRARAEELRRKLGRPWRGVSGTGFKSCLSSAAAKL